MAELVICYEQKWFLVDFITQTAQYFSAKGKNLKQGAIFQGGPGAPTKNDIDNTHQCRQNAILKRSSVLIYLN